MISPINFLWKQLNGPQITAFTKAIYNWCVDQFDSTLDYFNNLSIATAKSDHLTLFGVLANFSRPYVRSLDLTLFYFTEYAQSNFRYGFSSLENIGAGGRVVALDHVYETMRNNPLNDTFYRILLSAYSQSEGELGSLVLLDDIIEALRDSFGSQTVPPEYTFTVSDALGESDDYGDLHIDLGNMSSWNQAESVTVSIEALTQTAYAPLPKVFVAYSDT